MTTTEDQQKQQAVEQAMAEGPRAFAFATPDGWETYYFDDDEKPVFVGVGKTPKDVASLLASRRTNAADGAWRGLVIRPVETDHPAHADLLSRFRAATGRV